jgi:hypothetical protein
MSTFRARFDISVVNDLPYLDPTWEVMGVLVDATGSFTAMDISVGDMIICRGYTANSQVIFDRFRVTAIVGRDLINATLEVVIDKGTVPLSNSGRPGTGSFPIGSHFWYEHLTVKASFYQNQFDPDYDAGIDNLNLEELTNLLRSLESNSFPGGHHCYASLMERDNIPVVLRIWGMHCSVFNDPVNGFVNGNYELVYNEHSTDLSDNLNWRRLCKNIIGVSNESGGTVLAERHRLGYPLPHFYKWDPILEVYNLAQLSYEMDNDGNITWASTQPITGYIILT